MERSRKVKFVAAMKKEERKMCEGTLERVLANSPAEDRRYL